MQVFLAVSFSEEINIRKHCKDLSVITKRYAPDQVRLAREALDQ